MVGQEVGIYDVFNFFFLFNSLLSWFDSAKAGFQSMPALKCVQFSLKKNLSYN